MSKEELRKKIAELLDKQGNKCALTGLALAYTDLDDVGVGKNLRPSLDRISSDGHYEKGNLQVVCRFANFWKGDMADKEFRCLLKRVREVGKG